MTNNILTFINQRRVVDKAGAVQVDWQDFCGDGARITIDQVKATGYAPDLGTALNAIFVVDMEQRGHALQFRIIRRVWTFTDEVVDGEGAILPASNGPAA